MAAVIVVGRETCGSTRMWSNEMTFVTTVLSMLEVSVRLTIADTFVDVLIDRIAFMFFDKNIIFSRFVYDPMLHTCICYK